MTPLLIRCEATPLLGHGHVLRCFALAHEWVRQGGRAVFLMGEVDAGVFARLRSAGIVVEVFQGPVGTAADAAQTARVARNWRAAWTVVDGPAFGAEWESGWSGEARLLRIDDNGLARAFRADLILNQNLGAAAGDYPKRPLDCRLLLGPDFVLLRSEFLGRVEVQRGSRLVVTLGGSDPACATERVLAALLDQGARHLEADFILGGGNPRRERLVAAIQVHEPRLRVAVAPINLAERFAQARLAVTAGGTTLYELALLRTPMVVLCTAENQRRTCERFAVIGAAHHLGWHAEVATAQLAAELSVVAQDPVLCRALARAGGDLVDGLGAVRVVEAMRGASR